MMMKKCVSIDSSTNKTGMSLFVDGNLDYFGLIDLSNEKLDANEKINEMGHRIMHVLDIWKPDMVFVESTYFVSNADVVRKLAEVLGIIRGWTICNGAIYEEVKATAWRKLIGMSQGKKKRSELKQMSMDFVKETYGIDVNDDVADSICIGAAMTKKYEGEN